MSEKIKAITFDLDDTFWDVKPVLINAEMKTRKFIEDKIGKLEWGSWEEFKLIREKLIVEDASYEFDVGKLRKKLLLMKIQERVTDEEAAKVAEQRQQLTEYRQQTGAQRVAEQNQAQADLNQRNAEIDDTRNKENWGAGEYVKEVFSAVGGGIQDTASSLVTLPERVIDFATGEMARESKTKEGYKIEQLVESKTDLDVTYYWDIVSRLLDKFGLKILSASDLNDAAKKIVEAIK